MTWAPGPSRPFDTSSFRWSFPGIVAGSIFTFSLTLGDFIIPQAFGTSAFFLGRAVYVYQGHVG